MKDRRFFVYAIIIALAVPAIIGTMYFIKLSRVHSRYSYLSLGVDKSELLILGDTAINGIQDDGASIEFWVTYASGLDEYMKYRLNLHNLINTSTINDMTWTLYKLNDDKYQSIAYGSFGSDNIITLIPFISIKLKGIDKYKLYIQNREKHSINMNMKVELEKE